MLGAALHEVAHPGKIEVTTSVVLPRRIVFRCDFGVN